MTLEFNNLDENILDIRTKLYNVQLTFGFNSKEANYIEIIANECINALRKSTEKNIHKYCNKRINKALENIYMTYFNFKNMDSNF